MLREARDNASVTGECTERDGGDDADKDTDRDGETGKTEEEKVIDELDELEELHDEDVDEGDNKGVDCDEEFD